MQSLPSPAQPASRWVGLVTPVPSVMARPLVESLTAESVCGEHDIAQYVPDPPEGLIGFDRAVELALKRIGEAAMSVVFLALAAPLFGPHHWLADMPPTCCEVRDGQRGKQIGRAHV
mgnify:CR=1 FL=1